MAKTPTISASDEQRTASPRSPGLALAEIAKLQSDAEYIKRDVSELRTDVCDVRDRLARLEERVLHLPGKGFIVVVVTTALVIIGGLVTIAPKLQALSQTATQHG